MLYTLSSFTTRKSPHLIGQPAHLEKIISVRGRSYSLCRKQDFEAPIGPLSMKFNNRDYKDPLGSNKSRFFKNLFGTSEVLSLQNLGGNCYS